MSNRLDTIVGFVDKNKSVADIGTDHGITAIKIYEEKRPTKIIGTDISKNSLKKLEDKLAENKYKIETMVTDGIYELEEFSPQVIIISGMGGHLVSEIIAKGIKVAKNADKLILQANNSLSHLRKFLHENSFEIVDEKLAYDDEIYYDVIVARYSSKGVEPYDKDYQYEFGKLIIDNKDPLLTDKINKISTISQNIKRQIKDLNTESSQRRITEIDQEDQMLKEVLTCL